MHARFALVLSLSTTPAALARWLAFSSCLSAQANLLAFRNATELPRNVLLARVGHALDQYHPQTPELRRQHERQGHQSLKALDWSLWGIRGRENAVRGCAGGWSHW